MKSNKILKILGMLLLIFGLFRLINPEMTKSVRILDCESEYKMSIFGREYEGFRKHNAKMEVAKCLCEKYLENKDPKYSKEIYKILTEETEEEYAKFYKYNSIDSICKNREKIFFNWYYE